MLDFTQNLDKLHATNNGDYVSKLLDGTAVPKNRKFPKIAIRIAEIIWQPQKKT